MRTWQQRNPVLSDYKVCALNKKKHHWARADVDPSHGPEPSQGLSRGRHVDCLMRGPLLTAGWSYLRREVTAEFELLQGQGHGVCPEEKDEWHECQVWDELAGITKEAPTIVQTLLFAQQGPVQRCEVKRIVLGDQDRRETVRAFLAGQLCPPTCSFQAAHTALPCSKGGPSSPAPWWCPETELCFWGQAVARNDKQEAPWEGQKLTRASSLCSRRYCCVWRKSAGLAPIPVNHGSCPHRLPGVSHMYPPFPSSLNTLSQTGAHTPPLSDLVTSVTWPLVSQMLKIQGTQNNYVCVYNIHSYTYSYIYVPKYVHVHTFIYMSLHIIKGE